MSELKRSIFVFLATINRWVLPRYSQRDLNRLSTWDKALIGWRYFVTKGTLRERPWSNIP